VHLARTFLTTGKLIDELAIRYCAEHEMGFAASDLRDDCAIVMTLAADDVNSEEGVHVRSRSVHTRARKIAACNLEVRYNNGTLLSIEYLAILNVSDSLSRNNLLSIIVRFSLKR